MSDNQIFRPENIPAPILAGIDRYSSLGVRPGDCLYHILCGDLYMSIAHAAPDTLAALPAIVAYITTKLSDSIWGTEAKVDGWIERNAKHLSDRIVERNQRSGGTRYTHPRQEHDGDGPCGACADD